MHKTKKKIKKQQIFKKKTIIIIRRIRIRKRRKQKREEDYKYDNSIIVHYAITICLLLPWLASHSYTFYKKKKKSMHIEVINVQR